MRATYSKYILHKSSRPAIYIWVRFIIGCVQYTLKYGTFPSKTLHGLFQARHCMDISKQDIAWTFPSKTLHGLFQARHSMYIPSKTLHGHFQTRHCKDFSKQDIAWTFPCHNGLCSSTRAAIAATP